MNLRHLSSWKPLFYEQFLPWARRLGPERADRALGLLGRLGGLEAAWPPARRRLDSAIARADRALWAGWDRRAMREALQANRPRYLARDCTLDGGPEAEAGVLARFDVRGEAPLRAALAEGRGAILVGSHFGGHVAALHWLYRARVGTRLLVQRPRHVSRYLHEQFDRPGPHPQSSFFVRRDLSPTESARRMLRCLAALRDGLALYFSGDVPWAGPNARPGRLAGVDDAYLSVWVDLAVLARVPVFSLLCAHRPGGRFALTIEPLGRIDPGAEDAAVARFLTRLEAAIAADPADAIAHLTWPCYQHPQPRPAPDPAEPHPAEPSPALLASSPH